MSKPNDIPQSVWDRADDMAFYDPTTEGPDGNLSRYKLREAIAREIMATKAEERQVFVEMIEQFGSAKLIRHCRAALSNSERTDR